MDNGYIKISRKITEWEWYQDQNTRDVFIHCLLKANWKDGKFQGHDVPRGSFITSFGKLASELNMSVRSVRTALSHLEQTGEITRKTTSKWQAISLVNYEKYQDCDSASDKQVTSNRQASDKQVTTIEEKKEIKKERSISYSSDFEDFWRSYPKHQPSKSKAFESFKKAIRKTDLDTMLNAISEQRRSEQWKDERYIPMATTWLNQERWEYELAQKEVYETEAERRAREWA